MKLTIRPIETTDRAAWQPLWDAYNAFYGRAGATALPSAVTDVLWQRFFDASEPVFAFVAERDSQLIGIAHYLFHRSTTRIAPVCYLQDLLTAEAERGHGVGRALIEAVQERARAQGSSRLYWHTQTTNVAGRALYDKLAAHTGFIVYAAELA